MSHKPQKLMLHVHEDRKIFHVSLNNADRDYTKIYWRALASKARYAYDRLLQGERANSEQGLCGGMQFALVNTNYQGWVSDLQDGEYEVMAHAIAAKDGLIAALTSRGLTNVGVRNITSKSDPANIGNGSQWNKKFNVAKMTRTMIYAKIELINRSLQMQISREIQSLTYRAVVISGEVDNMATMLMFVRRQMGLI
jgi:hypothetical protein